MALAKGQSLASLQKEKELAEPAASGSVSVDNSNAVRETQTHKTDIQGMQKRQPMERNRGGSDLYRPSVVLIRA